MAVFTSYNHTYWEQMCNQLNTKKSQFSFLLSFFFVEVFSLCLYRAFEKPVKDN